jgi:Glycosyl transferase family 90
MLDVIPAADIHWHMKKDAAVWRGALTGIQRSSLMQETLQSSRSSKKNSYINPTALCMSLQRCKLVMEHASSRWVNASLTGVVSQDHSREPILPERLENGVQLYGSRLSYTEMLQYKIIIVLEGNDISTGLKWALYSNSVVFMQPVTYTSWAMEELLEPWIHFIPIAEDLSDIEEKVHWVLDHDVQAQMIARRGSLWICDLIYHPDVFRDEEEIVDETLIRYKQHFALNLTLYERHVLSLLTLSLLP